MIVKWGFTNMEVRWRHRTASETVPKGNASQIQKEVNETET